jgi:hypothetical protein
VTWLLLWGHLEAKTLDSCLRRNDELRVRANQDQFSISGKNLTIRARAGTTPLIADYINLSSAHRLVLQGLDFNSGVRINATYNNSTLILLQNTLRDRVLCYGVKCVLIGNRFDAATLDDSILGSTQTLEVIFAGNQMLQKAYTSGSQSRFFRFNASSVHILGNQLNLDVGGYYSTYPVTVERGFSTIIGNRFTTSIDRNGTNSTPRSPGILHIENAAALIRNNVFTLTSATSVSGYPVSSLRAIDLADVGSEVRIHNNVIDFRNVNLGGSVNAAEGAIAIRRHVESVSGNVFLGLQHAAVNVDVGIQATIADNLCHQVVGSCPGTGAVTANPLFANAATGNYHLQAGSPAINAGPQSPYLLDIDGTRNDIGAHGGPFDLDQFDVQRGASTQPFVYPLFDANRSIDGNGNLQIRLIGVARNQ